MKKVIRTPDFAMNLHMFWVAIPGTQNVKFYEITPATPDRSEGESTWWGGMFDNIR